jgi:uncharacterized protein
MFKPIAGAALVCAAIALITNWSLPPFSSQSKLRSAIAEVPGQVLPVTARAVLANQVFDLEVAQKPQQQSIGLMYRTFLPANRGMLFPFQPAQTVSFWMKHCRISLDMIFLRQNRVVAVVAQVPPCTADPCPSYGPTELVDQVLEIRSGRAAEIGLKVGDTVKIQRLK